MDSLDETAYISSLEQRNREMRILLSRILWWWETKDEFYAKSILADEIREIIK
jgi:hypothetical protein